MLLLLLAWPAFGQSDTTFSAEVTARTLNVRSSPDADAPVVAKLALDDRVETLEREGDWVRVVTPDGVTGWVAARYLAKQTFIVRDAVHRAPEAAPEALPPPARETHERVTAEDESIGSSTPHRWEFGALGGGVLGGFIGGRVTGEFDYRTSFTAGAIARYALLPFLRLHGELCYTRRGAVVSRNGAEDEIRLDYLELQVSPDLEFETGSRASIFLTAGGIASYNINAAAVSTDPAVGTREITDIRDVEFGLQGGLGVLFEGGMVRWIAELTYARFVRSIHDAQTSLDLKNEAFVLKAGFVF